MKVIDTLGTFALDRFLAVRRLIARQTLASSRQKVPVAVTFAQVGRSLVNRSVFDARPLSLHDRCHVRTCSGVGKHGKIERDTRADHVVDTDGEKADARPLVEEGKVQTRPRYRNAARFRVDGRPVQLGEHLVGRHYVHVPIGAFVPGRRVLVAGGSDVRIRLEVEKLERFSALLESSGVRVASALSHAEPYLDVETIGVTGRDERGSQPAVDRRRRNVADGVDSDDFAVFVCVAGFSPLKREFQL